MITKGMIVKSDSGRRIRVDGRIMKKDWNPEKKKWEDVRAIGGQGEAFWATEMNSGEKGVVKVFHKQYRNSNTVQRINFLINQDFPSVCPAISAPTDLLNTDEIVGHYTPKAEGETLEKLLIEGNFSFPEGMQLAIATAHAMNVLHQRGIAHGDLRSENLIINRVGSVFQLHVIDLDNFNAPGMPPPPCAGFKLYMAPELQAALEKKQPAIPTVETDLYSLAVLMHEIILLCHPSAGNDDNEADFQKAMCSGKWLLDPAAADGPGGGIGGYPTTVLNADLARLFRSAVSIDPTKRPSSDTWEAELGKAFNAIYCCPKCGGPCVIDVSKTTCPLCGSPFPHLTLRINGHGGALPLTNGATVIGRAELGGSMKVSVRHAVFRRVGPETWLESTGSNGTYRWNGSGWTKLPDRKPLLVQHGDRLRLGDVEVQLN